MISNKSKLYGIQGWFSSGYHFSKQLSLNFKIIIEGSFYFEFDTKLVKKKKKKEEIVL